MMGAGMRGWAEPDGGRIGGGGGGGSGRRLGAGAVAAGAGAGDRHRDALPDAAPRRPAYGAVRRPADGGDAGDCGRGLEGLLVVSAEGGRGAAGDGGACERGAAGRHGAVGRRLAAGGALRPLGDGWRAGGGVPSGYDPVLG